MSFVDHDILIFDGACGTNLQGLDLPVSAWDGKEGCNEVLNLTVPEVIVELHGRFLDAGARVLETNTFGASRVVLSEYGLEHKVAQINQAAVAHARRAIGDRESRYVAGSIGPGTKLPSLGHISVDALAQAIHEQVTALVEAGVDALILETCQDLLQLKTALVTCFEVLQQQGIDLPVLVSVTMESQGTMLVGSDIAAVAATVDPYPVFSLGLNCATGPEHMESHIRYLSRHWDRRISCLPNQGLPEVVEGKTVYPLSPEDFTRHLQRFVIQDGVSIVGGCCGTTPAHIRALVAALDGVRPAQREECS
jgi:5-methyltetrahydrofolate--homocysteine methyltransferase